MSLVLDSVGLLIIRSTRFLSKNAQTNMLSRSHSTLYFHACLGRNLDRYSDCYSSIFWVFSLELFQYSSYPHRSATSLCALSILSSSYLPRLITPSSTSAKSQENMQQYRFIDKIFPV
ncbi:hypothetical protein V6N13_109097 [Hibiscus sabdariffa]